MNNTVNTQNVVAKKGAEYRQEFMAKFNQYLATQPPVVRGLHLVLKGLAMLCFALTIILGIVALYYTILWAATGSFSSLGKATYLPLAWVNFGLSCSFLVFPWGLDAMLMRAFPTGAFLPIAYGKYDKPVKFMTGLGAFFAGLGIMCAGAPGASHIFNLASQAIHNLF